MERTWENTQHAPPKQPTDRESTNNQSEISAKRIRERKMKPKNKWEEIIIIRVQ